MKRHLAVTLSAAIALWAAPLALAAGTPDRIYEIASILQGRFEGSTPGNELTLQMGTVTIDPSHPFDVFVLVTGRYQGDNVRQQGVIRLETQGQDIYFTYIPHFDPAITLLSNDVGRFTERELTSACSFTVKPQGRRLRGRHARHHGLRARDAGRDRQVVGRARARQSPLPQRRERRDAPLQADREEVGGSGLRVFRAPGSSLRLELPAFPGPSKNERPDPLSLPAGTCGRPTSPARRSRPSGSSAGSPAPPG